MVNVSFSVGLGEIFLNGEKMSEQVMAAVDETKFNLSTLIFANFVAPVYSSSSVS